MFTLSGSTTQTAGSTQFITLAATDINHNIEPDYTGTKTLTFTGANPTTNPAQAPTIAGQLFNQPIQINFNNGAAVVPL